MKRGSKSGKKMKKSKKGRKRKEFLKIFS